MSDEPTDIKDPLLARAEEIRWQLPPNFQDRWVEAIYGESGSISDARVTKPGQSRRRDFERSVDRILTSRWTGIPAMILVLGMVLWVTIEGANVPSKFLDRILIGQAYPMLHGLASSLGSPAWLSGMLIDGMYLTVAWVVAVMLPPMMIFFPLFTILEDLGYLPRVAFNLDRPFQLVGAHGKQALTMCMGLGCNAAGVVATRVIDSPRERLIAIITNNFALCNGRWPTQILIASIFLGAAVPAALGGLVAAATVTAVALFGVFLTFASSWFLSRTFLRGEASSFSLELPPYRPPQILRTLYTSMIDRTMFVLWRAIVFAAPAGVLIWVVSNVPVGDQMLAELLVAWLEPAAWTMGLTGVVLLAYIIAIPANEIVIPTILMLTVLTAGLTGVGEQGAGVIFETDKDAVLLHIFQAGGWTTLTAVCLLIFSLCHNPCSTTIYTIWRETRSVKWTVLASVLPLVPGVGLCMLVAFVWRGIAGG
jgi:ferrous iron transport protein B